MKNNAPSGAAGFTRELEGLAVSEGMALFGAADIAPARGGFIMPERISGRFGFAVSIGLRLSRAVLESLEDGPNQLYYFHYQRANMLLDITALKIASLIQRRGFDALPVPASQVVDWEKQLGSVSHREIARLAGLGWYGRNNLLVNPCFGSQVRYATVLTDMPLEAGKPPEGAGCGSCRLCAEACPAGAIGQGSFDLEKCREKLKEFMKTRKIGQMICGMCVRACAGDGNLPSAKRGRDE